MSSTRAHQLLTMLAPRLSPTVVSEVVEYMEADEPAVAVEWLCDALFEIDASLQPSEADALLDWCRWAGSTRYTAAELSDLVGGP